MALGAISLESKAKDGGSTIPQEVNAAFTTKYPQEKSAKWKSLAAGFDVDFKQNHRKSPLSEDNPRCPKFITNSSRPATELCSLFFTPSDDSGFTKKYAALHRSPAADDEHAGEEETSVLLYLRPDLVQLNKANTESGGDQHRLTIPNVYAGIYWYASFPNHYADEGAKASRELGGLVREHVLSQLTDAFKAVKADQVTLRLQNEFFKPTDSYGQH